MMTLIRLSGPFGIVLVLLAGVVLFLAVQTTVSLLRSSGPVPPPAEDRLNALLFWGCVAAVLGFLGQCTGSYLALTEILRAPEISPYVVAEGFVISFVPTLFGLGILFFALVAWVALRLLARGNAKSMVGTGAALFSLLLLSACSRAPGGELPASLTEGVWILDAAPDLFLWEFTGAGAGLTCIVHDLRGPVKLNETPCQSVEGDGAEVRVTMDTGVRLEGEAHLDQGRFVGRLLYPDGGGMDVSLPWSPRDRFPALLARGAEGGPYRYRLPPNLRDGWVAGSAEEVGVDPRALEDMVAAVQRGEAGVLHSLLIAREGRLIMEEYFHGYGPGDLHHLASCTKSIASLLVGLAIQEGKIPGVDVRVADFFPEDQASVGQGWDQVTLEDLLTMSMALDWSPQEADNLHGTGPEFFRRVLSRSVSGTPGRDWAYVSANVDLLAGILFNATGEQAEDFARRALFEPMGIGVWDWEGMKTDGYNLMDGSLQLLPRDMAKIGEMVLDGGGWQGESIVAEEWIRVSTARHLQAGEGSEGYGYLWWLMDAPGPFGAPVPAVFANGWGSQFIVIFPTLAMVVVTTGGNEFNGKHMAVAEVLREYLLPGVQP